MQPLDPLARLVRGLDLEPIGRDSFRARTGASAERLFGGLLLAQAAIAAGRTVEGRHLHSLHASFLRPGRSRLPLALAIERLRDGRSFSARRGTGRQGHDVTIVATASFTQPANGIAHQDRMPDAPSPEGLPDWEDLRARVLGTERREDVAVELRVCDADPELGAKGLPAYRRVWIRPKGQLSDDPLLHAAMFVFASDRTLLRVAARPHGAIWSSGTRRAWTTPSGFIMSAGSTTSRAERSQNDSIRFRIVGRTASISVGVKPGFHGGAAPGVAARRFERFVYATVCYLRIADVCKPALQRFLQPAATRHDHLQTEAFAVKHACCDVLSVLLGRRGLDDFPRYFLAFSGSHPPQISAETPAIRRVSAVPLARCGSCATALDERGHVGGKK